MNGKVLPGDLHEHTTLGRLFHGFIHPRMNPRPPVDQAVIDSAAGRRAVIRSAAILIGAALVEFVAAGFTQSAALVADGLSALAAAATAIPLVIAASPSTEPTSKLFTYGRERAEDLLTLVVWVAVAVAALGAGVFAIARPFLFGGPQFPIVMGVAAAIGFVGHETAATLRLTAGRALPAVALSADGRAAILSGAASLLAVAAAIGVALGWAWADGVAAVIIAAAVVRGVWRSSQSVTTRLIDGIEEDLIWRLARAIEEDTGIDSVTDVRARWAGHRLHVEVIVGMDSATPLAATRPLTQKIRAAVVQKFPAVKRVSVAVVPIDAPKPAAG